MRRKILEQLSDRPPRLVLGTNLKGTPMAKMIFVSLPVSDVAEVDQLLWSDADSRNDEVSAIQTPSGKAGIVLMVQIMLMTHDKYMAFNAARFEYTARSRSRSMRHRRVALPVRRRPAGGRRHDRQGQGRRRVWLDPCRSTISTSCMAAASRIPTATCGAMTWMDSSRPRRKRWPRLRTPSSTSSFARQTEFDSITTVQIAA